MSPTPNTAQKCLLQSEEAYSKEEILIRGKYYDISEFKKHHPGGGVIKYYLGQDATEPFNAFHSRSAKAEKYLSAIPSREKSSTDTVIQSYQENDPLIADFEKLRLKLHKEGYYKTSIWYTVYQLLEIIIMNIIGVHLLWNGWWISGIFFLGIAQGRSAALGHETGHYSLTGHIVVDRLLEEFVMGFGVGMSASYWRNQHNKHHAMTQKLKHDVDLNTLPLVAFNAAIAKNGNRKWLRWQAFTFTPIVTVLVAIFWSFYLHPKYSWLTNHKKELLYYILRYVVIVGVVLHRYTLMQKFFIYFSWGWITSIYLFINFALSHTHTPVLRANENRDWVRYAAYHTVDVEHTAWCTWWMYFLNFQIEHHLFPSIPQFRNREIVPMVKALFEKHGLPYKVLSYREALVATFSNLHKVGQLDLEREENN